jgi:hypothetical protein
MMTQVSFETMTDAEIRQAAGLPETALEHDVDDAAQARVYADALIRARGRFDHYRALYAAFIAADKPWMIENLDEIGDGAAEPAKLIFADEDPSAETGANPMLKVWTERSLLAALSEERAIQDFFAGLLDELAPRLAR